LQSTLRAFAGHFLSPVLPRLIVLGATFAQVSLVESMVSFVADKSIPRDQGPVLVWTFFVVYGVSSPSVPSFLLESRC
jgi:hypothetical protein